LIKKTKERETAELSTIYGMGAQHKEKILEGIRELDRSMTERRRIETVTARCGRTKPTHGPRRQTVFQSATTLRE
jgi:hypothetical protein